MSTGRISRNASAVVTGAGSGIGRAFALELARRGGRVVCSDIKFDTAQETVEQIESQGGQAFAVACDVTKISQVEALAVAAEEWLGGPVDLVINNAGVGAGGTPVGEVPMADWKWVLGINLWGVIHGCHVFAPKLRELGRGGIINVGSTASFSAAPLMGPYNVSKAGVLALSETLAAEFSGTRVNITALCPTFVKTNIARDGRISGKGQGFASRLIDRGASPDKIVLQTLSALDRGQLYVVPQLEAKAIWRFKRFLPSAYTRGAGVLNRVLASRA